MLACIAFPVCSRHWQQQQATEGQAQLQLPHWPPAELKSFAAPQPAGFSQLQRLSPTGLASLALSRPSPTALNNEPFVAAAGQPNGAIAQQQQQASASDQPTRSGSAQASGSRLSGEGPRPELPLAPDEDAASEAGVVVECEEGAIRYVKVHPAAALLQSVHGRGGRHGQPWGGGRGAQL